MSLISVSQPTVDQSQQTADYSLFSVLDGQGSLKVDGQDYDIAKGNHFILPSDVEAWQIKGNLELIVSHP